MVNFIFLFDFFLHIVLIFKFYVIKPVLFGIRVLHKMSGEKIPRFDNDEREDAHTEIYEIDKDKNNVV